MTAIPFSWAFQGPAGKKTARAIMVVSAVWLLSAASAVSASMALPPLDSPTYMVRLLANPQKARAELLPYSQPGARVNPGDAMLALNMIAQSYELEGRYKEAIIYAQRYYTLAEKHHDLRNMAQAMNDLGANNRLLGNLDLAVRELKEAAALANRARDANLWGQALFNLSVLMADFGDYENALTNSLESQSVMENGGGRPYPAKGFGARANIFYRLGQYGDALITLDAAQKNLAAGDAIGAIELAGMRSLIYEKLGQSAEAGQVARKCLRMNQAITLERRKTYPCHLVLAMLAITAGNPSGAREHLATARQILIMAPDSSGVNKQLLERDFHLTLEKLASSEGRTADVAAEQAILSELERKITSARQSSQAAAVAAQIKIEGKDLNIALLEARNANLRIEARERLAWIFASAISALAILIGLFLWYRARQLRLQQEQRHTERARIARDLHDTLLQNMAGTQLQLQAAAMRATREQSPLADRLGTMVSQLGDAMASARDAVWQLRSAVIERGELGEALTEWVEQICRGNAANVIVETGAEVGTFSPEQAEDMFRIVQEAVSNATRHAAAQAIKVRLSRTGSTVELAVSDDGQGFVLKPDNADYGGHWGLVGMRERAKRLGGTLVVDSAPGAGTRITLTIPA